MATPQEALTLGAPRLRASQSLKHQKNWKAGGGAAAGWYDRGAKTFQASKYRKGACEKYAPPRLLRCLVPANARFAFSPAQLRRDDAQGARLR